jgi:hypothetical protein
MKYAIYDINTKGLKRISDSIEFYDSITEGFTVIADFVSGESVWEKVLLNFRNISDPAYLTTPLSFINKFSLTERVQIHTVSATSPIIRDLLLMIIISKEIDLCSDNVTKGLEYLTSVGILTPQRVSEIRGF